MTRQTARSIAAVGVAVLGVVALAAEGGSSSKPDNPSSPGATATGGGGANADVTISKCAVSDNQFEGPAATLTVLNNSSKPSNYIITVAFESKDGKTQIGTGNALVQNLAPGQSATSNAPSLKSDAAATPFNCKVVSVTRTAAS